MRQLPGESGGRSGNEARPILIVFDMDGVLVDVTESYRETIVPHGGALHRPRHQRARRSRNTKTRAAGTTIGSSRITSWQDVSGVRRSIRRPSSMHFQRIFLGNGRRRVDSARAVDRANRRCSNALRSAFDFAIFTGRPRDEADFTLHRFASGFVFDPIVADDDVAKTKPAPDGLLQIAEPRPDPKLWYVGDTVDDARSRAGRGRPVHRHRRRRRIPAPRSGCSLFARKAQSPILDDINHLEDGARRMRSATVERDHERDPDSRQH